MNRYENIGRSNSDQSGSLYYTNNLYPDVPFSDNDSYVISTLGDRFDIMASNFYGDSTLWWVIPVANSLPGDSLFPPPGLQLRIPNNLREILQNYKYVNIIR